MNSTCLESGDQPGLTQQPSAVSCINCGCGVGVRVGVGDGALVFTTRAVVVGPRVVGASVATSIGADSHPLTNAIKTGHKLKAIVFRFIFHPSSFILIISGTNRAATDS